MPVVGRKQGNCRGLTVVLYSRLDAPGEQTVQYIASSFMEERGNDFSDDPVRRHHHSSVALLYLNEPIHLLLVGGKL